MLWDPPNSVKNIEWWKVSDGAKRVWKIKWWVMSDGNWVTEIEWWKKFIQTASKLSNLKDQG